jgi:hypothetical protein
MNGTLVYSDTAVTSADSVVSIGRHTIKIAFFNTNNTTSAEVKLNNQFTVLIPHSPANGSHVYHEIDGDYTKYEVLTAGVTLAVYAIG